MLSLWRQDYDILQQNNSKNKNQIGEIDSVMKILSITKLTRHSVIKQFY